MTYFLSDDYYAEKHYESIGHARRLEFNPRGDTRWRCECGAVGAWNGSAARAKRAFAAHVNRAISVTRPESES